ncbi:MAG: protease inhibitor I42 family protein [Calditrichaeota bacterium]|nr:protease inhibitor I42 family protein [Calditrichota bacterium]
MRLCAILIIAVALGRCNSQGERTLLTKADHGREVRLRQGQEITLALEGNPTTGFTWEVAEVDSATIAQAKEVEYVPRSNLMGAPGTFTFRFKAVKNGVATLRLVYRRPWEKEAPADTFTVRIVVK